MSSTRTRSWEIKNARMIYTSAARAISLANVTRCLFVVALIAMLTACGGSKSNAKVYDVKTSATAIQNAGWKAEETKGIPDTRTKVKQVGYLETTALDGQKIDVQFFEDAPKAQAELAEAKKQDPSFQGETFRNVILFSHPDGKATVPATDMDTLHNLLQ